MSASAHPKSELMVIDDDGICLGLKENYDVCLHGGFETTPAIPSKCGTCSVIMQAIWETVCSRCRTAHCYAHSQAIGEFWVCDECRRK